jgi:hypothetical protein
VAKQKFRAAVLFWSAGGNTRDVADTLYETLKDCSARADMLEIESSLEVDYNDYNLILLGAPEYRFLPPEPVQTWLQEQQNANVDVLPAAPERGDCWGAVFCTYGGPHTGVREAVPALKYLGQYLEHAGIPVLEEWPVIGEFHTEDRQHMNTQGRLGDIRGRPNQSDLKDVGERLRGLLRRLRNKLPGSLSV